MPLPSTNPSWATDTNFASGPDSGLPTKETPAPSAGVIAQGFIPGTPFTGPRINWILNLYGQWLDWLGTVVSNRTLTIPVWQAFPGDEAVPGTKGWQEFIAAGTSPFTTSVANVAHLILPLSDLLPDGAVVSKVEALVTPGAARTGANRMSLQCFSSALDWTTPAVGGQTSLGAAGLDDTTANNQRLETFVSYTVNRASATVAYAKLRAGNDAGTNADTVYGFRVTYTGPPSLR